MHFFQPQYKPDAQLDTNPSISEQCDLTEGKWTGDNQLATREACVVKQHWPREVQCYVS